MEPGALSDLRRLFLLALLRRLRVMWPVLSGLMLLIASLGGVVGVIERWGVPEGIYFAFVTSLTIGYGDFAPSTRVTRVMAVAIGLLGILFTGLVAALAVTAFEATPIGRRGSSPAPPEE
ncbi:potassium channel family protein [Falsiroseomonas sp. HW251]|uniref:potassium channel family protein n=1 Tax=Falsiroseomonas sp. HW251 TaxID=3390998 RepID=UPI003D319FF2